MQTVSSSTVKSQSGFFPIIPHLIADIFLGASVCSRSEDNKYPIYFFNEKKTNPQNETIKNFEGNFFIRNSSSLLCMIAHVIY